MMRSAHPTVYGKIHFEFNRNIAFKAVMPVPHTAADSYENLRMNLRPYINRTAFIVSVMTSSSPRNVITRPPHSGKTLLLDTLKTFLEVNPTAPGDASRQRAFFAGLKVTENQPFCDAFMGRFPVLSVSLRTVAGSSFETALAALINVIVSLAAEHDDLLQSPRLSEDDKRYLQHCLSREYLQDPSHVMVVKKFLSRMTTFLAKHYDRRVVLLIDDWDVPLQATTDAGYCTRMLDFLQSFLAFLEGSSPIKIHGLPILKKTVLMGYGKVKLGDLFVDTHYFDVRTITL